jgi:DNA-directed RNA polymerase subunit E'/Rpb7
MATVTQTKKDKPTNKKIYEKRILDVYSQSLLTKVVELPMNAVGKDIKIKLEQKLKHTIEGICIAEGYVKPNTVKVLTYSSGKICEGNKIHFEVVFECDICLPVEGMLMEAVAVNITKAGIRAEIKKDDSDNSSPVIIFLARDHHYEMDYFSTIKENDKIKIRVIGQRFELKDKYISIIAELIEPKKQRTAKKPRLVLKS